MPLCSVVLTLGPHDEAEEDEDLGLDLQRYVEVLDDIVHAEGGPADGPGEVHGVVQAVGAVGAVVLDDLRYELSRNIRFNHAALDKGELNFQSWGDSCGPEWTSR